jgi:hypothetical protein
MREYRFKVRRMAAGFKKRGGWQSLKTGGIDVVVQELVRLGKSGNEVGSYQAFVIGRRYVSILAIGAEANRVQLIKRCRNTSSRTKPNSIKQRIPLNEIGPITLKTPTEGYLTTTTPSGISIFELRTPQQLFMKKGSLVAFGFGPVASSQDSLGSERCRAPEKKNDTRDARKPRAMRGEFLHEDDNRENCDPKHIHDAPNEQQRHQDPTAAHAEGSMLHPHTHSPKPAGSPMLRKKFGRIAAMF